MVKTMGTKTTIIGLGQGGSRIAAQAQKDLREKDFTAFDYNKIWTFSDDNEKDYRKRISVLCPFYKEGGGKDFYRRNGDFSFLVVDVDEKAGVLNSLARSGNSSTHDVGHGFQGYEQVLLDFKPGDTGNSQLVGRKAFLDAWKNDKISKGRMLLPFQYPETAPENIMLTASMAGGTGSSVSRLFTDELVKSYHRNSIINAFMSLPEGLQIEADSDGMDIMPAVGQYFKNSTQFLGKGVSAQEEGKEISAIRGHYLFSNMNPQKVGGEETTEKIFARMNQIMSNQMITVSEALRGRSPTGLSNLTVQELKKQYGVLITGYSELKLGDKLTAESAQLMVEKAFSPCAVDMQGLSTYHFSKKEIGSNNLTREFAQEYVRNVMEGIDRPEPSIEIEKIPLEHRANQVATIVMVNAGDSSNLTENVRTKISKSVSRLFPLKTDTSREYCAYSKFGPTRIMGILGGTVPSELLFTTTAGLDAIFNYDGKEVFERDKFYRFVRGEEGIKAEEIVPESAVPMIDSGVDHFSSEDDRQFYEEAKREADDAGYTLKPKDVWNIAKRFRAAGETARQQVKRRKAAPVGNF